MSSTSKFSLNEKLLCYHGPLIYTAKCIKIRDEGKVTEYLVHYERWNKQWDEWVTDCRLLKNTRANQDKKDALEKKIYEEIDGKKQGKRKRTSDLAKKSTKIEVKPAMKNTAKKSAVEEAFSAKITVPENLKSLLVDDWDLCKKYSNVLSVPHSRSITAILKDFSGWKIGVDSERNNLKLSNVEFVNEFTGGIIDYFNVSLEKQLLYPSEKDHMNALKANQNGGGSQFVETYGVVHLLRLMVKIDEYLNKSTFMKNEIGELVTWIDSFLRLCVVIMKLYFYKYRQVLFV